MPGYFWHTQVRRDWSSIPRQQSSLRLSVWMIVIKHRSRFSVAHMVRPSFPLLKGVWRPQGVEPQLRFHSRCDFASRFRILVNSN